MSASFKLNDTEIFSELNQTVTAKNINVAANDTTTPSMCKAWVNFDGTYADFAQTDTLGTGENPYIRAAYNVSSIDWHQAGDYTVNYTNDIIDEKYCVLMTAKGVVNGVGTFALSATEYPTKSKCRVITLTTAGGMSASPLICVAIFR